MVKMIKQVTVEDKILDKGKLVFVKNLLTIGNLYILIYSYL